MMQGNMKLCWQFFQSLGMNFFYCLQQTDILNTHAAESQWFIETQKRREGRERREETMLDAEVVAEYIFLRIYYFLSANRFQNFHF